ncbi:spore coat associated protein CotJA [Lachnospiraceae bacterium NSJ-143]|nr:spore coat associated protein CotJA [Lachnospiraceae bacterium NSJ-143]
MKQVYDEYYKIFSCRNNKNCGCQKCPDPCDMTPDDFCYEPADCNDCIIERVGLSEAYVPYQTDFDLMDPEESLMLGTAFKNLVIPYSKTSVCDRGCN